ncbi:MAG: hypothetical protein ABFD12_06940 [Syntrophorhabdus sp.]
MADRSRNNEDQFETYDPDNLPYEKQWICEIIRDLPEVTPEEIAGYHDN